MPEKSCGKECTEHQRYTILVVGKIRGLKHEFSRLPPSKCISIDDPECVFDRELVKIAERKEPKSCPCSCGTL